MILNNKELNEELRVGNALTAKLTDKCRELEAEIVQTRQDTLRKMGKWIDNHVVIATEQEEVIPGKLSVSTATYGFHTKEWHELLDSLKRGELPKQSGT